ncbi:RING-H2 finger protein ATL43 [Lycium barbarum]|uniref:RING-H2 finger protein ATL43 n=1 Tax=Lycium barbarum TaxID=112863 RepID=UPI00293E3A87|nr:RING-H2 finger protein ATL43 [Lycium barbarum]
MSIEINVHFLLPSLLITFLITSITTSSAQIVQTPSPFTPLLPDPPPPPPPPRESPFRPSIAIVVAILTTIFSITFLLLLYAKHCKRGPFGTATTTTGLVPSSSFRKNSGIDRTVIESLPVFRFGSLRGPKADALECAVCLNKFEPSEILRLLPKCKHAFHVECVDTWLDAHSTCPLCRYQVHPEDILLISHENNGPQLERKSNSNSISSVPSSPAKEKNRIHSSSGRHSSAGERGTGTSSLHIIVETPKQEEQQTWSFSNKRMSLDSWNFYRKKCKSANSMSAARCTKHPALTGYREGPANSTLLTRKDGMLLSKKKEAAQEAEERRLEHRIIISGENEPQEAATSASGAQYRWSDVEACDMLYLRSEMILLSESRRYSGSRKRKGEIVECGRRVINERSVSEMTGMSRFRSNNNNEEERERERERQRNGAVTRWLAWISQSQNNKSVPASSTCATC